MDNINYYAVVVSALLAFAVGGLWYSPFLSWQNVVGGNAAKG